MKKVLLIGSKSGEIVTGLSIGFDLLLEGLGKDKRVSYNVINKSLMFKGHKSGAIDFKSIFKTLNVYFQFVLKIPQSNIIYTTISSSIFGFFRDSFFIMGAFLLRKKIVLHLYGGGFGIFYQSSNRFFKKFISFIINRVHRVIVEGELLKDQFSFMHDFSRKVKVIPNGLPYEMDIEKIHPKKIDSKRPINLLYLSNMIASKGYKYLLDACKILHEHEISFHCHYAGEFITINEADSNNIETDIKKEFQEEISKEPLSNHVTYYGVVKGDDKLDLLKKADIFVLPTHYPWEGQPFSIIEALSMGIPVISTNYRGIPEQIIDQYNGFFVQQKSPKDIASKIRLIVESKDHYEKLSKNAIEHFKKKFTKRVHLENLINEIINV